MASCTRTTPTRVLSYVPYTLSGSRPTPRSRAKALQLQPTPAATHTLSSVRKAKGKARELGAVAGEARGARAAPSGALGAGRRTITGPAPAHSHQVSAPPAAWTAPRPGYPAAESRTRAAASSRATGPRAASRKSTWQGSRTTPKTTTSTCPSRPARARWQPPPPSLARSRTPHPSSGQPTASPWLAASPTTIWRWQRRRASTPTTCPGTWWMACGGRAAASTTLAQRSWPPPRSSHSVGGIL